MKYLMISTLLLTFLSGLAAQDIPLSKILVDKETWREIANGFPKVTFIGAASNGELEVYQTTLSARYRGDGRIEKARNKKDEDFEVDQAQVISSRQSYLIGGGKWVSTLGRYGSLGQHRICRLELESLKSPSCLTLWPDEGHLVIGESDGAYIWAVRIEKDGKFGPGDRYYSLRTKPNEKMHVTAMVMDAGYLLYACTPLGIQVFDPTGRLSGVIAAPSKETMTAITIGGASADELFVAAGEKIYARRIQGKAAYSVKK